MRSNPASSLGRQGATRRSIPSSTADTAGVDGESDQLGHIRDELHAPASHDRGTVPLRLRELTKADWLAVRSIYEQGIAGGQATFETEAPMWAVWDRAHSLRLVAEQDREVLGWAALSPVSERCVYGGVVEDSVYVADSAQGRGIGRALLEEVVRRAERDGVWTIQAGIFPENESSIALHERCGFRVVGMRERIGKHHGVWRDVVLMERRSEEVS
jgi:L-amino acid N-acyltransferase YncA